MENDLGYAPKEMINPTSEKRVLKVTLGSCTENLHVVWNDMKADLKDNTYQQAVEKLEFNGFVWDRFDAKTNRVTFKLTKGNSVLVTATLSLS